MTKRKNTAAIGKREERQIVKDLQALGYDCRRQPGSGNRAVDLQHDVLWLDSPAGKLHIESKYRTESSWKVLERWRSGADVLIVRCNATERNEQGQFERGKDGEAMAFLPWKLLLELVGRADEQATKFDPEKWIPVDENATKVFNARLDVVGRNGCKATQTTYTPPPKRKPPKPNKLRGRKFQRKAT